jgi:hypothetical protein
VDAREKYQLDMVSQVARVKARARPWRSIIALVLAAIAAGVSWWAAVPGRKLTLAGHPVEKGLSIACAVAFCLLALAATLGLSGRAREMLEPVIGSAHAAVIRYAIVLAGGLISLLITLELLKIPVGSIIVGGAFTAVLIGIAAQQALGNLFSGIMLQLARPFVVGDTVRMRAGGLSGQIEGTVTDIGITYVRLDTDEGKLNVPNSQVLAAAVGPLRRPPAPAPAGGGKPAAGGQPAGSAQPPAGGRPSQPAQSAVAGQPPQAAQSAAMAAAATPPGERAAPPQAGLVTGPDGARRTDPAERGPQP